MKRLYFGTDGVRGRVGGPVINAAFAARLGWAAARARGQRGEVLIGRDPRASSLALAQAVAHGLQAAGAAPRSLGVLPTPAVALAVRARGAGLGVMITASHNPAADNGIKFFAAGGLKLGDEEEFAIEAHLPATVDAAPGNWIEEDGLPAYRQSVQGILPAGSLRGWRIVVDTAHGATCGSTPRVLRELGAELTVIGAAPDGTNINAGVGSEHPEKMAGLVAAGGCRLGLAHDGDGDRGLLCDERGGLLDGDEILAILAQDALARDAWPQRCVVVTVQSNLGLDAAVAGWGGRLVRTPVGDRYVSAEMRRRGALLGGESSGHIISADLGPGGDGLTAALRVIAVMQRTGRPLSELRQALRKFPQGTRGLGVREKVPLADLPRLAEAIRAVEAALGARGRVLVRYSGTEAKLRLLVEAESPAVVEASLDQIAAAVGAEGILG